LGLFALGFSGRLPGFEAPKASKPPPAQEEAEPKTPPEPEKAGSKRVLKGGKEQEMPGSRGPGEPAREDKGKPGAQNAGPPQNETKASDGSASKAPAKGRESVQAEPSAGEGESGGGSEKAAAGGDAKEKPLPSAEASGEGRGGAGRESAAAGATGAPMAAEGGAEGALQAADLGDGVEAAGAQGKGVPGDAPDVRGGGAAPGAGLAQTPGVHEGPAAAPQDAPLPAPWPEGEPPEGVRQRAERYLMEFPLSPEVRDLVERYFELSSP